MRTLRIQAIPLWIALELLTSGNIAIPRDPVPRELDYCRRIIKGLVDPLPRYEDIVPKAQQGDVDAREILAATLMRALRAYFVYSHRNRPKTGYAIVRNKQERKELIQLTVARAMANLHKYDRSKGAFSTWLYAVARNEYRGFVDRKVRERKRKARESPFFEEDAVNPRTGKPEKKKSDEIEKALHLAISKLSENQQKAVLAKLQGLKESKETGEPPPTNDELAARVGMTPQQFKGAIDWGFRTIRQHYPELFEKILSGRE